MTASRLILIWSLGAAAGLAVMLVAFRPSIRLAAAGNWIRSTKRLSAWLGAQVVVAQLGGLAIVALAALLGGVAAAGVVRVVQTCVSPLAFLFPAVSLAVLPGLAAQNLIDLRRSVRRLAVVMLVVGVTYFIVMLLFGDRALAAVLGPTFENRAYVVAAALIGLFMSVAVAPGLGTRALRAGNLVFATQVVGTFVGIGALLVALPRAGAEAVAWVLVLQAFAIAAFSFAAFAASFRRIVW